jgi:hypothetical protein
MAAQHSLSSHKLRKINLDDDVKLVGNRETITALRQGVDQAEGSGQPGEVPPGAGEVSDLQIETGAPRPSFPA